MKNYQSIICYIFAPLLVSCIPTVEIDPDPIPEKISISSTQQNLIVGEQLIIDWNYTNEFKQLETISPEWINSNEGAAKVINGQLQALKAGQVKIKATLISIGDTLIESNELLFTIVEDKSDLANVTITNGDLNLDLDQVVQLLFTAKDGEGNDYLGTTIVWSSSNETVATVSGTGEVVATGDGSAAITLTIDGIESAPIIVKVGASELLKSGDFQDSRYSATGKATLRIDSFNELILDLSNDFSTQFLKGTWVFMSNSLDGNQIKVAGLRVQNISSTTSGAQSFNITDIDDTVDLDTYKYVIILCEPAGLTMAYAELE